MASSCILPYAVSPERCAELLRWFRLPRVGATLPMGLAFAARRLGLGSRAGALGIVSQLRFAVDSGRPVIVLVQPSDITPDPVALHFRVVVGYELDSCERVSHLLLACSSTPHTIERGWNVRQPIGAFYGQWHNWLLPRWYLELSKR